MLAGLVTLSMRELPCVPTFFSSPAPAPSQACLQKHPEHVARIMEDSAEVATDEQAGAEEAAAAGGGSSGNVLVAASPSEAAQQTAAQQ